jgi:hypothetical protein
MVPMAFHFLEVKRKTVHGRTVKARIPRSEEAAWNAPLTDTETRFLNEHYGYREGKFASNAKHIQPMTLVSTALNERITIDTDLVFFQGEKTEGLGSWPSWK